MDRNDVMRQWDRWRHYIATGGGGSWPRDAFESVLDEYDDEVEQLRTVPEDIAENTAAADQVLTNEIVEAAESIVGKGRAFYDSTPAELVTSVANHYEDKISTMRDVVETTSIPWRTIDSAPRDGMPVLIKGGEYISDTSGEDGYPDTTMLRTPIVASYYHSSLKSPYGSEWVWGDPLDHFSCRGFGVRNPTHWASL